MPALQAAVTVPSLSEISKQAEDCTRCLLYRHATQTVFGEGPSDAPIMLVGEQPGDQEDRAGRPFVGPAGHILDEALEKAGLERATVYLTNAVKHFKHEMRGKRRMHKKPNQGEVQACRWWLDLELQTVHSSIIVAMGVTAAKALLGRTVVLAREGGRPLTYPGGRAGLVTFHPSAILRMPDKESRHRTFESLVKGLCKAREMADEKSAS